LISIASSFCCLARDGAPPQFENLRLQKEFSTLDEADVLVVLEVDDGSDCIGVHSRFELKNRLRKPPRQIRLAQRAAIGDSSQLVGFHS
jgi:hypothetical protein